MGYKVGLDIGIASVGWAVVDDDKTVIDAGSRLFEAADANKNEVRRSHRGLRRLGRRKIHRITMFEKLWSDYGLTMTEALPATPLELRNSGQHQKLNSSELFVVLKNLLKHRGISYLDDAVDESETVPI